MKEPDSNTSHIKEMIAMTKEEFNDKLALQLIQKELMDYDEALEILSHVDEEKGITAKSLLLESGKVTEWDYVHSYALAMNILCCDLESCPVFDDTLKLIPGDIAMKYCCFPLNISDTDDNLLCVVTDEPETPGLSDELKKVTGKDIQLLIATRSALVKKIEK